MEENNKFVEELTRVNNELTNLQRDLAKSNADLKTTSIKLKETNKELEAFISMVSHELRTPLTSFKLSLALLRKHKEKLSEDKAEKIYEMMDRNISLMSRLIDDLLLISKIDAGKLKLEKEDINLSRLLEDLKNELGASLEIKNIKLDLDVDLNLNFKGDPLRIQQILRILIDNSIKYSEPGSIIRIITLKDDKSNINLDSLEGFLIKISDQGIGIPKKDLINIFKKFYRAENAGHIKGTGLGLSIAERLVLLHNGTISVESVVDKGTTFTIFLPY